MTTRTFDPVFAISRVFIYILLVLAGLAAIATFIATPAIFIFESELLIALANEGQVAGPHILPSIAAALGLLCITAALSFLFLIRLLRIVNTVGKGDPFSEQNADRLQQMGIFAVFIQITGFFLNLLGAYVDSQIEDSGITFDLGFDGLLIGLLLLILARVFRKGAEMREDLEGTV